MASFSPKSLSRSYTNKLRSVSLPTRSHPSTIKIEQLVNKIKSLETETSASSSSSSSSSKADAICNSLSNLKDLYEAIEALLSLQLTQQALSRRQEDQRVNDLIEESVTFIDVCNNTRDAVMQMKQGIRGLQSSLRRNKLGELRIGSDISAFLSSRKGLQKEILNSRAKLKSIDSRAVPVALHPFNAEDEADQQLLAVLKVLTESSFLTISTFSSLLVFLSAHVMKSNSSRWWLVSKLMKKGAFACEGHKNSLNELENVDIALGDLLLSSNRAAGEDRVEYAQKKLEVLEDVLEGVENRLELLFRHLIRSRVSLLNTLTK